ncbi:MAG: hypothetical protein VKL42_22405 [Snowella sp.]|jgi:hypothetical protein|nr:hypothetical protein [Snowella sp.]
MLQTTQTPKLSPELSFADTRTAINVEELERLLRNVNLAPLAVLDQETKQQILRSSMIRMYRLYQAPRRSVLKLKAVR